LHVDFLVPAVLLAPFIGSFLGVLIVRVPEGRDVVFSRSACSHCGHWLGVGELLPLVSWIWLRGVCRICSGSIGLFYPAIELAAVAVVIWAAIAAPSGPALWASCIYGWMLLTLAIIDQRHFLLPDVLTLPMILIGLAVAAMTGMDTAIDHALGAAGGFLSFALIAWVYRRLRGRDGLGEGDAKLLAGIGAWVSWTELPRVVFLAALLGLAIALSSAVRGRRLSATDRLPFGTFLAIAGWLVWLYGPLFPNFEL
jgi:leader peptidase (prepilin peptidase)/N-methyltransferase